MSGLEAYPGELACERTTAAQIAEIKALNYAMLACRAQNDLAGYYRRNRAIHDKISEAARNTALRADLPLSESSTAGAPVSVEFWLPNGIARSTIMSKCSRPWMRVTARVLRPSSDIICWKKA